jgi:hypothetical protein
LRLSVVNLLPLMSITLRNRSYLRHFTI